MTSDIYQKLARHLDNLPGGYPSTESGVEQRILQRLFTPEQAELALHLSLLPEEARVIARRAKISDEEAERRLEEMSEKGLIFSYYAEGKSPRYQASQFIVGIYEFQLNNLNPEFVEESEEYLPSLMNHDIWKKVPQLRTIPIGESVDVQLEVMGYEKAEELVRVHKAFAVAPCICRKSQRIIGQGCDKPLEVCLSFGDAADFFQRNGLGRAIEQEEALNILNIANEAGLVLQPSNSKEATFLCCCCGDCCGVLQNLKRHPKPASIVSSPFRAILDPDICDGCLDCTIRCQMEAVNPDNGTVAVDKDRCIGCGLCVTNCPSGAMTLMRKPESELVPVPENWEDTSIRLGKARGKLNTSNMVKMMLKSKVDRLLTSW